ncbi:MAG TPA: metalloregulator ArsR/SmtB family transcription factor [Trebonia sp.]
MEPDADLAAIGRLIGDPNRARILQVLMGGVPQSGSALAEAAGISRALASSHLKKLTAGGLVRAEQHGRQQLYSIAAEQVAEALETLQLLAPVMPVRSLRGSARMRNLRWARTCYDHLAGVTGVAVTEALAAREAIGERDGAWVLGAASTRVFDEVGIDVDKVPSRTRPLLRPCMDWTERRHHLAGGLGAAVAAELTGRGWVRRQDGSRIVTVTPAGHAGLETWLGLDLGRLRVEAA